MNIPRNNFGLPSNFSTTDKPLNTLDENYNIHRTSLRYAIMMDFSGVNSHNRESSQWGQGSTGCGTTGAINFSGFMKKIVETIGYRPMGEFKGKKIEIGFKNEQDREYALKQKWEFNGYEIKAYRLWHHSEIVMRLTVSNFGGDVVGKELEEKLKVSFSIYGKVASCTHLLDADNEFYSNNAVIFIIPNDDVLVGKLVIPNKFLVRKDLPIATCTYEPAEVKCIHCKSNTHNSNQCETVDSLKRLFELADTNLDSYEKV